MRQRRRVLATRLAVPIAAGAALVLAGCSSDDAAAPTTTTDMSTTTVAPPGTTAPDAANDQPMPVAWVRQVGGPGDDVVEASAGRGDEVLGIGTTTGLTAAPTSGPTAAFVDLVAAADGAPRGTAQSDQASASTGRAIATADDTGTTDGTGGTGGTTGAETTVACGTTDLPATTGSSLTDVWCATAATDGSIGTITATGSDQADSLDAVSASPDGQRIYAAGRADGLFPEARDPTGGFLGGGDALVVRLDATGVIRWARQFGTTEPDEATGVAVSDDGDAIVAGSTGGRTDGDVVGTLGGPDAWVARMDPDGNQRWLTQFGTERSDRAVAVAAGGDPRRGSEAFVAVGSTDGAVSGATNLGGRDALVSAFDASGRQLWSVQVGSAADDDATGVAVDGSTVYVTGTAAADIVGGQRISLTPATPSPDSEAPSDTAPTSPTTTAPTTTAPTTTAPPGGGKDGFLAAFDVATGTLNWVAQFGSVDDEVVTGMSRTESGLVVVSGSTTGQLGTTAPGGGVDGFMVAFVPPSGGGGSASIVSARPAGDTGSIRQAGTSVVLDRRFSGRRDR